MSYYYVISADRRQKKARNDVDCGEESLYILVDNDAPAALEPSITELVNATF